MALNYEVKKRVFGFDETKTEKYVAQMKTLGSVLSFALHKSP